MDLSLVELFRSGADCNRKIKIRAEMAPWALMGHLFQNQAGLFFVIEPVVCWNPVFVPSVSLTTFGAITDQFLMRFHMGY